MAQVRNSYQKQWLNFDDSRVTANDERQVKVLFSLNNISSLKLHISYFMSKMALNLHTTGGA
jgi:hypothetical protein